MLLCIDIVLLTARFLLLIGLLKHDLYQDRDDTEELVLTQKRIESFNEITGFLLFDNNPLEVVKAN